MLEYPENLSRFHTVTSQISPSSVTFSGRGVPLELYDEEIVINILEELNPEMADLIREYGLSKTLSVLDKLELLEGMKTEQVN